MIHRDKQARFPQGMDFRGQALQLFDVGVVTGEQDDAADEGVAEALPIQVGEFRAGDVNHQRAE